MPNLRMQIKGGSILAISLWLFTPPQASFAQTNVIAWGNNNYGKIIVPLGLTNAVEVAAGFSHSLALRPDGTVAVWGDDQFGQTEIPGGLTNAVAISADAGSFYSAALCADGQVVVWPESSSAGSVPTDLTNAVAIAAGSDHCLALRRDGTVCAWGVYDYVPPGLSNIVALAAGDGSLALSADGTVVAWGTVNAPLDLTNVVAIAARGSQNLALRADGTVVAWGQSVDTVPASATNIVALAVGYVHVLGLKAEGTMTAWGTSASGEASVPPGLSNVVMIAAGGGDSFAVVGSGPPYITCSLVDRAITRGRAVYFRTQASGQWPLDYQWQFNGTDLSGENASVLVLTNTQPSQAGVYTVIVTNALGVATNSATLAVIPESAHIMQNSLAISDGHFQFNATASPPGTVWIVQASTNATDWVDMHTVVNYSGILTFTDGFTNYSRRFYRLRLKQ